MNTESRIRKYIDDNWDGTLRFVPEDGDTVMADYEYYGILL